MSRLKSGICSSMTPPVLQKLQSAGVATVVDFVSHDLDVLATKSGVGYRELAAIRRAIITEHSALVVSGSSLFDIVVATTSIISTGSGGLDNLLDGGLFTGEITELTTDGSSVSGGLLMNTMASVVRDMDKNVVYVDCGNHFDVNSFAALLDSQPHVDTESSLQRLRVVKCFDMLELLGKLSVLCESSSATNDSFCSSLKLIVIDGVVDCILPSISCVQNSTGCGYVTQLVCQLRVLTTDFSYAVLLSNYGTASIKISATSKLGPVARLWLSVPDTRLDIGDVTEELNGKCQGTEFRAVRVTLGKSSRQSIGQSVELKVNGHLLFV